MNDIFRTVGYSQCQPGSAPPVTTQTPVTSLPPVTSSTSVPPTQPSQPPSSGPIITLPLGDSITFGLGSNDGNAYRKALKDLLQQDGITIDYIGSTKAGNMQDNECTCTSGATIEQISGYATQALTQKPAVRCPFRAHRSALKVPIGCSSQSRHE